MYWFYFKLCKQVKDSSWNKMTSLLNKFLLQEIMKEDLAQWNFDHDGSHAYEGMEK